MGSTGDHDGHRRLIHLSSLGRSKADNPCLIRSASSRGSGAERHCVPAAAVAKERRGTSCERGNCWRSKNGSSSIRSRGREREREAEWREDDHIVRKRHWNGIYRWCASQHASLLASSLTRIHDCIVADGNLWCERRREGFITINLYFDQIIFQLTVRTRQGAREAGAVGEESSDALSLPPSSLLVSPFDQRMRERSECR